MIYWTAIIGDSEKRPAAGMELMHQFTSSGLGGAEVRQRPALGSC